MRNSTVWNNDVEMEQQKYNWKRYWYPRESSIELLDGGYLYKPDTAWGSMVNPALVTVESLVDVPCLIMLGEPGIGKTSEMENFEPFTRNTMSTATLWFDLKGYQTELLLQEELFKSPPFQSWLTGTHQLYLFLDGLDEGLLTISVLASLLARNLQKCPISRLHLRIACRTADWPNDLEETLRRLWGEEKVAVYQLAPLRREDVAEAHKVRMSPIPGVKNILTAKLANCSPRLVILWNLYTTTLKSTSPTLSILTAKSRLLLEYAIHFAHSIPLH